MARPRQELPEGAKLVGGPKRKEPLRWGNAGSAQERLVRVNVRPGYRGQWMNRDEVSTRLSGDGYGDPRTGEWVEISPWSVVKDKKRVEMANDLSSGSDTTVSYKECVLMEIPEEDFAKLERKAEMHADIIEQGLLEGNYGNHEFTDGVTVAQRRVSDNKAPGFIPYAGIHPGE